MMRQRTLHPTATPARLAYLRAVKKAGTYRARHGVVANHCLRLGWVDTWWRLPGSKELPSKKLTQAHYGDCEPLGQRITAEGLAVLDAHEPREQEADQ